MGLFLIVAGLVLMVAAVRNSQGTFYTQLAKDVPGFYRLAIAIVAIGLIGYIGKLKPVSVALMGLFLISILELNGTNFFSKISQTVGGTNGKTGN